MRLPPLWDHWECRQSPQLRSNRDQWPSARNHRAVDPNRDRDAPALPARPKPPFLPCTPQVGRGSSNGLQTAGRPLPRDPQRVLGRSASMWSSRQAVVDPVQEFLDFSRPLARVEELKRRVAVESSRWSPQPPRSLFRRAEGVLGGSNRPNHPDKSIGLLRGQMPDLAAMAERLAGQHDAVDLSQAQPARLQDLVDICHREPAAGRVDKIATASCVKPDCLIDAALM
jgi:hypothetical protein